MPNIRKKELSKIWLRKIDFIKENCQIRCIDSTKSEMSISIKLNFKNTRALDAEKKISFVRTFRTNFTWKIKSKGSLFYVCTSK